LAVNDWIDERQLAEFPPLKLVKFRFSLEYKGRIHITLRLKSKEILSLVFDSRS
jgi:hypothetical protein